jgi:putative ABC transport system permease protein
LSIALSALPKRHPQNLTGSENFKSNDFLWGHALRSHLWLIKFIGVIVPRRLRADWRQEWEAEIHYREKLLAEWDRIGWRTKLSLFWHSTGALMDALWLQPRRWEDEMFQDLRFGARMLLKNPGFSLIATFTLALGIGANTAIFSVVNGVLLKPLPYPEPEKLVRVYTGTDEFPKAPLSPSNFLDYREHIAAFESFACYIRQDLQLFRTDEENGAERLLGMRISSGYFRTLGLAPMLGREFTTEEELPYEKSVVILSHGLWQRRFNSDQNIIGKKVRLSGRTFTIVGVAPAGLQHVGGGYRPLPHGESVDIWWPAWLARNRAWSGHIMNAIGRLKPGITREQAEAEFNAIAGQLVKKELPGPGWRIETQSLSEEITQGPRKTLLVLLAAVFFVLLIACANTANLMLVRASTREREIAVRAALGAGRTRIIRQLLTESMLLAGLGGLVGLLVAKLSINALISLAPAQLPRLDLIGIDARILAFTLGVSLLTGLLFGLAPALNSLKLNLNELLKEVARGAAGGKRQRRLRDGMVIFEVALALVLLAGAGLLMRSFVKLLQVDPGFRHEGVLTMGVFLPTATWMKPEQQIAFYQQLIERISAMPGVISAGVTSDLPWSGYENQSVFPVEGKAYPPNQMPQARYHFISADYMRTIGVPLLAGRWFDARDVKGTEPVILINQSMARKYWPGEDAVGKRIASSGDKPPNDKDWMRIIGIIGDVKDHPDSIQAEPSYYWPITQEPYPELYLAVRTGNNSLSLAEAVRREVASLNKNVAVSDMKPLETIAAASLAGRRFTLLIIGLFALAAMALAAIGIYGVMSYLVLQRTREIGIRLALGAQGSDVLRLVVKQGITLAVLGIALGLAGAFALTRSMASLLFGVGPSDPLTFIGISALLALVALAACWIPARRAMKTDPLVALRQE